MSSVFISHSSSDNAWAEQVAAWLREQGYESLFLDFDPEAGIEAGAMWRDVIYRKLRLSQAVIALCSENFLASQWCLSEVAIATDLCKHLFPLRIGPGELPKLLQATQAIDLCRDPGAGYQRLAQGLERQLKWRNRLKWDNSRPPYPGLMACQEDDTAVFFGRDRESEEVLRRLRRLRQAGGAFLLLLGASGCGKSSLLRAGIVPQLRLEPEAWLVLDPFRPGGDEPFEELGAVLGDAFQKLAQPAPPPPTTADEFRRLLGQLRRSSKHREACVVLPIDQFEELLIAGGSRRANPTGSGVDEFLSFLGEIVGSADGRLLVVATLRSDFLDAFQLHPGNLGLRAEQVLLGPMQKEGILQVIEGPAARVGLKLEPGLSLRMTEDTGSGDALPLLAFTLRELWETHGNDGELNLEEYRSLGGLEHSVERAADEAVQAVLLSEADRRALRDAFIPAMVRLTEQGAFSRRSARWADLPQAAYPLLEELVSRRLLVTRGEGGEQTVEVAHEALLRNWTLLKDWLEESRDFLKGIEQINTDYIQWKETPQRESTDLLLYGVKLERARKWLKSHPQAIPHHVQQYITASADHQRRLSGKRRAAASFALVATLVAAYGLIRLNPMIHARILTQLALVTGHDYLASQALNALHEHRQAFLEGLTSEDLNQYVSEPGQLKADSAHKTKINPFTCKQHSSGQSQFCASEDQVIQLLEIERAPYSLAALKGKLAARDFGGRDPSDSLQLGKRFTPGGLKDTAYLIYDKIGAGADINADGTIDTLVEAMMIPCTLFLRIEELWTKATHKNDQKGQSYCHLFRGDPSTGDYSDPDCHMINNGKEGEARIEKQTLAFWLFDREQDNAFKRYQFCSLLAQQE
jgi:hypothetical protein